MMIAEAINSHANWLGSFLSANAFMKDLKCCGKFGETLKSSREAWMKLNVLRGDLAKFARARSKNAAMCTMENRVWEFIRVIRWRRISSFKTCLRALKCPRDVCRLAPNRLITLKAEKELENWGWERTFNWRRRASDAKLLPGIFATMSSRGRMGCSKLDAGPILAQVSSVSAIASRPP